MNKYKQIPQQFIQSHMDYYIWFPIDCFYLDCDWLQTRILMKTLRRNKN